MILVDANHEYDLVKNDLKIALKLSHKETLILLHDINLEGSGSKKLWKEIKKNKKFISQEIVHNNPDLICSYGIGLIKPK